MRVLLRLLMHWETAAGCVSKKASNKAMTIGIEIKDLSYRHWGGHWDSALFGGQKGSGLEQAKMIIIMTGFLFLNNSSSSFFFSLSHSSDGGQQKNTGKEQKRKLGFGMQN